MLSLVLGATESPEINKTCPDIGGEITDQDLWIGNSGGEIVSLRKGYFTSNLRPQMCGCGRKGRIGGGEHILGEKGCLLSSRVRGEAHALGSQSLGLSHGSAIYYLRNTSMSPFLIFMMEGAVTIGWL